MDMLDLKLRLFGESGQGGSVSVGEDSARSSADGMNTAKTAAEEMKGQSAKETNDDHYAVGSTEDSTSLSETAAGTKPNNSEKMKVQSDEAEKLNELLTLLGYNGEDTEAAMKSLRLSRLRHGIEQKLSQRNADAAYEKLVSESDRLSEKIKGFDIKTELADRRFAAMLHSGLSVEEAWRAVHFNEIFQCCAKMLRQSVEHSALMRLRAGIGRPDENGSAGQAPSQTKLSVDSLTGKGIRDILRRVENGAKVKF